MADKKPKIRKAEEAGHAAAEQRLKDQTAKHGTAKSNVKATEAGAAERKKAAK